ncbi:MAG: hypothetical protein V1761_02250, partial [bacterium]
LTDMARVLFCGEDQLTALRIGRELSVKNLAYDWNKNPLKKDDLLRYDLIVVHSSWKLPNLVGFIVNLVLEHDKPVIYLSSSISIGAFRSIMDDPYFAIIDDQRIDAEFSIGVSLLLKTAKALHEQANKAQKASQRADMRRQMDECKQKLIASGLTEEEAHRRILKTAMDRQISKYDACVFLLAGNNGETD